MRNILFFGLVFVVYAFRSYGQNTCGAPVVIGSLPYTQVGTNNCGTGSDYSGGCMVSTYSTGADKVYAFTPGTDMCVTVALSNTTFGNTGSGDWPDKIGLYLLSACPSGPGTLCMKKAEINFTLGNLTLPIASLTAGTTYYIIVDAQKTGNVPTACLGFDISVTNVTCPKPPPPPLPTSPQGIDCGSNLGFENGNLTNWTGCHYDGGYRPGCVQGGSCPQPNCSGTSIINGVCTCSNCGGVAPCCPLKCDVPTIQPANGLPVNTGLGTCTSMPGKAGNPRHVITTGPGLDPNSNGRIPVVAPGGRNFSVRIGNQESGFQAECLQQTFLVTKSNALFTYLYAVVLQDPSDHTDDERPRFEIKITDQSGASPACGGNYTVISKNAEMEGFEKAIAPPCGGTDVWYKRWAAVATDLTAYIGQNITIRFCTADCGKGGHFGYAYVDSYCRPLELQGSAICTTSGAVTLSAPQGFLGYSWYNGAQPVGGTVISSTYTLSVSPPVNGTIYTVKMENVATPGCYTYITDTIKLFTGSASGSVTLCDTASIPVILNTTVNDPIQTTYSWSPAAGLSCSTCPNPAVNPPFVTQTYTVTMKSASGCTITDAVTVTVNPCVIAVKAPPATFCLGACASLTATGFGGTAPYTYTWQPGSFVGNPFNVCPSVTTTYTVSVREASGSTAETVAVVTVNPNPVIHSPNLVLCKDSTGLMTATGASTYTWQPGGQNGATLPQLPTAVGSTTYTITGTNAYGCTHVTTAVLTVVDCAIPSVTVNNPILCIGACATLTATGKGGAPPLTYQWIPDITSGTPGPGPFAVCPQASSSYTVIVTDSKGDKDTAIAFVKVNPLPVITTTGSVVCAGTPGTLSASGANTYTWMPGLITGTPLSLTPAASTSYTVTGTDINGCVNTATAVIIINPLPVITATGGAICQGSTLALQATGASTYVWSPATGLNNPTLSNPLASPLQTTTYTITGTHVNGCTNSTTAIVVVESAPTLLLNTASICVGTTATLTASGAASYTWLPSGITGATQVFSPSLTTTYTVMGASPAGCTASATTSITVNPMPIVNFEPDTAGCKPLVVTFKNFSQANVGNSSCSWNFSGGTPSSSSRCIPDPVTYSNPGVYSVTLTVTSNGCSASLVRPNIITVYPFPTAYFTADPLVTEIMEPTITFTNKSSGEDSCSWDFGDNSGSMSCEPEIEHTYEDTGTYHVCLTVKNNYNCPDVYCLDVLIKPVWSFYIPNAFTPNKDGKNEFFIGKGYNIMEHQMWIFDRWGNLIYESGKTSSPDMVAGWDGRANGGVDVAQQDVYVWLVILKDIFNKQHKLTGHVTLVK